MRSSLSYINSPQNSPSMTKQNNWLYGFPINKCFGFSNNCVAESEFPSIVIFQSKSSLSNCSYPSLFIPSVQLFAGYMYKLESGLM